MKNYILILSFIFSQSVLSQTDVEKRLNQLEQTVLDLEIKSLFNKILFSGELTTNFSRNNIVDYNTAPEKRTDTLISNTLQLNANSNIGKRFKIYTSLEASFYFGENLGVNSASSTNSLSTQVDGDHIRVTKAYFDYHLIPRSVIASLGRLATTDGPPAHFYSLEDRLGTYASIAYSVPVDGAALSWNMSKTFNFKDDVIFRAIYGEGQRVNRFNAAVGVDPGTASIFDGKLAKDDNYSSALVEYNTKRASFLTKDLNFIVHYIYGTIGSSPSAETRGLGVVSGDRNIYEYNISDDEFFKFDLISFHTDLTDVFGTNLDFYGTHVITKLRSKGEVTVTLVEDHMGGALGAAGTQLSSTPFLGDTDRAIGRKTLVGTRYKFSPSFALGAEYLHATKGSLPTTSFTQAKTNIYNVIGKVYHTFLTKTFNNKKVITRFGYSNALNEYIVNTVYAKTNQRDQSVYGLITLKF
jgi:hypothetical protein